MSLLRQRWLWITAVFAAINVCGYVVVYKQLRRNQRVLVLEQIEPRREAELDAVVRGRFSLPMVRHQQIGKEISKDLISISPEVEGAFVWDDIQSFRFDAGKKLELGRKYTVKISKQFRSLTGLALEDDIEHGFTTEALQLVSVSQHGFDSAGRATICMVFNDRIAEPELRKHLKLSVDDGIELQYTLRSVGKGHTYYAATKDISEIRPIQVMLKKGLKAVGKDLGLANDVHQSVKLESQLRLWAGSQNSWGAGWNPIRIRANHEIDLKTASAFLGTVPETKFTVRKYWGGIELYGDFNPESNYKVKIRPGLKAVNGIKSNGLRTISVRTPSWYPVITFKTRGIYMLGSGNHILPLETVNVEKVKLKIHRIYANNVTHFLRDGRADADLGEVVYEGEVNCGKARNVALSRKIDLRKLLAGKPMPGVYMVSARRPNRYWPHVNQILMVTDLGMHMRVVGEELLVWTNGLRDAGPVVGTKIRVFDRKNQPLGEGVTDKDGLLRLKMSKNAIPYLVWAEHDKDVAFICTGRSSLSLARFDIGGRPYLGDGYDGFIYSDRGIYRPGEKVELQGMVRERGLKAPQAFPIGIRVYRPDGKLIRKETAMLSEFGSAGVSIPTSAQARTGVYRACLVAPGNKTIGECTFRVEDFMPDRMTAEITDLPQKQVKPGETVRIRVAARHNFGAPAKGRIVKLRGQFVEAPFSVKKFRDYRFVNSDVKLKNRSIDCGEAKLDEDGSHTFVFKIPGDLRVQNPMTLQLTGTVHELGGRAVSTHGSLKVDGSSFHVGIRRRRGQPATVDRTESFDVVCVTPDEKLAGNGSVSAEVYEMIWHSILRKIDGDWRYQSELELVKLNSMNLPVNAGRATFDWIPPKPGQYRILVSGDEKRTTCDLDFLCTGPGYVHVDMANPDQIEMTCDKKVYAAGDTAKVSLKAPFPGRLLLTVEGRELKRCWTTLMKDNTHTIELPVQADWGPNAYLCATLIRGFGNVEEKANVYRAFGVTPIMLDQSSTQLKTTITAPEVIRPKSKLTVKLKVTNQKETGVPSEVTVAAIDEGILNLINFESPDPWSYFTSKRALSTNAYDVYHRLMPEIDRPAITTESIVGGGAGARRAKVSAKQLFNPVIAQRVMNLALVKRNVRTKADGTAEIDLEIPQFNGSLRLMAVVGGANAVGSSETTVTVREPLMIRASLPRFVAPNDAFTIPVAVFNRTGNDGRVELSIEGSKGIEFDSSMNRAAGLKNDGECQISFKVRAASTPGVAKILLRGKLGNERTIQVVSVPIRSPGSMSYKSAQGRIAAGTTRRIVTANDFLADTAECRLVISTAPQLELAKSLRYLLKYPYGCLEQTTSGTFPLLHLSSLGQLIDPKRFEKTTIRAYVQSGIGRVLNMQHGDGSFGWWPGTGARYDWGSVYATHMLVEADKAGYLVDAEMLGAALDYLQKIPQRSDVKLALKAYACYVLAKANRASRSWTMRLYEQRKYLPLYSRYHLAVAMVSIGERQTAMKLIDRDTLPAYTDKRDIDGLLHSSVRQDAILLSCLLDIDPDRPMVKGLAERLSQSMKAERWYTTQNNAFALLAVGRYLARETAGNDVKITVMQEGKPDVTVRKGRPFSLAFDPCKAPSIRVKVEGRGKAYYHWGAVGIPSVPEVDEFDRGLEIRRNLLDRKGMPLSPEKLKQGDLVIVELRLRGKTHTPNVVINDLLPAGLEIENPHLQSSESMPWIKRNCMKTQRVERRDDRMLVFTTASRDWQSFRYAARVVTRGKYEMPPVHAFCMYDPKIASRNGMCEMEVVR